MSYAESLAGSSGPILFRRIDLYHLLIPMLEPFRISSGAVTDKECLLLRLGDGEAWGWGESSALSGGAYSAETPESCQRELVDSLLPSLIGRPFASMAELEQFLAESTVNRFVRVAVETAAWEIVARRRGVSLRQLFGLPDRPIPSGLAIGLYETEDELGAAIERYEARQYKRLKIKIKRGQDVTLVRRVRQALGDFPLFVDANADYGRQDFAVFQELDAWNLMMFEQPLAKGDLEDSAALQRQVRTPICLDESIETAGDAVRALELGSCRIINIKLQRVGGYFEALRIIEVCEQRGVPVWMGTMPELGVGSAQALMLAAHPAFTFPTDVEPSTRWYEDDILEPELCLHDGCLTIPPGQGLGFAINEEKVARYATRQWRFPAT
jgi:O-succinylbenzoate synthase